MRKLVFLMWLLPGLLWASDVSYFVVGSQAAAACGAARQANTGGGYVACNSTTQRCELTGVTGGCVGFYYNGSSCTGGISLYCTIAQCPSGQTVNPTTGECEEECSPQGSSPGTGWHWDYGSCSWEYDNCTTEAPLWNTPDVYLSGSKCNGGCVYNPYSYDYTAGSPGEYSTDWRQTGFQCTGSEAAAPLNCGPNSWATPIGCAPLECPVGQSRNAQGECEPDACPAQQHRDESGVCVWDACPAGEVRNSEGNCVSAAGQPGEPGGASGSGGSGGEGEGGSGGSGGSGGTAGSGGSGGTGGGEGSGGQGGEGGTGGSGGEGGDGGAGGAGGAGGEGGPGGEGGGGGAGGMGGAGGSFDPGPGGYAPIHGSDFDGGAGIGDQPSFGESAQAFFDQVQNSGIGGAAQDVAAAFPSGGSCPFNDSVEVLGASVSFSAICDLWADVSPTITSAMHVAWLVLALMVLLSA